MIDRRDVQKFLKEHRDLQISPAKFEYSLYLNPEFEMTVRLVVNKNVTEKDIQDKQMILDATEPDVLLKLMRKKLSVVNRSLLRNKILAEQERMMPLIKDKAFKTLHDVVIENILFFFLHCNENESKWILDNYKNIRSEYLRGLLCLVIGFRGEAENIPFLINEAKRFERDYPNESYDQGPTLAVQELAVRFLNKKR